MYFTSNGRIWNASLDGTSMDVFVGSDVLDPIGLTLDIPSQTLYWADRGLNRLEYITIADMNRVVLAQLPVTPLFVSLSSSITLYFSATDSTVRRLDDREGNSTILATLTLTFFGLEVVDSLRQMSGIVDRTCRLIVHKSNLHCLYLW